MKRLIFLITCCFPIFTNAGVGRGMYAGQNENAWWWKSCGIEIFMNGEGGYSEVSVSDSGYVYKFAMEGKSFSSVNGRFEWWLTEHVVFKNETPAGLYVYTNRLMEAQGHDVVVLSVYVDDAGTPVLYNLRHASGQNGKEVNMINCAGLQRF